VTALTAADLIDELRHSEGPFTLFAPTETAFVRLSPDDYRNLFEPENKAILQQILLNHIVTNATIELSSGTVGMEVTTLTGSNLTTSYGNSGPFVNDVPIFDPYILALNGVIHAITELLIPEGTIISNPTSSPVVVDTEAPSNSMATGDPTRNQTSSPTANQTMAPTPVSPGPTVSPAVVQNKTATPVPPDPTNAPTVAQEGAPTSAPADPTNPPTGTQTASPTGGAPDPTNSPTLAEKTGSPTLTPPDSTDAPADVVQTAAPSLLVSRPIVEIDDFFANVTVRVMFDDFPEEIGWLIQDISNNSLVSSRPIGSYPPPMGEVEEIILLPEGVYLFGIEDSKKEMGFVVVTHPDLPLS
jgi:hypothetical protein